MTKPKKKPKTGDVVWWVVLDRDGEIYDRYGSRKYARHDLIAANKYGRYKPYRIAKIVLAK